jgi:hypothetical protein
VKVLSRWATSFGRFLKDFLIGDAPIFLPVTLAAVGIAFALRHDRVAAVVVLPIIIAVVIAGSAIGEARRSRHSTRSEVTFAQQADDRPTGAGASVPGGLEVSPRASPPSAP